MRIVASLAPLGAVVMCVLNTGGLDARDATQSIQVIGKMESLGHWSARMGRSLSDRLDYPAPVGMRPYAQGYARIGFRCSDSGKPVDAVIVQSSRTPQLDQAALRAIGQLPSLHPLPEGVDHDRTMEAWVFFADSDASLVRLQRAAQRNYTVAARTPDASGKLAAAEPIVIAARF